MNHAALADVLSHGALAAATVALAAVLAAIAWTDSRSFRIPDLLSIPLIVGGLGLSMLLPDLGALHHVAGAVGAYLLFSFIGAFHFRRRGFDGLGLGDAKLFAAAGAWLGWQLLPLVLLIASVSGLCWALAFSRNREVAFGPWLAAAFFVVWGLQITLGVH
ncbi:MAG: prepilin peptidase [Gemmobacter sp.]